jgi:hypothetical protein
MSQGFGPSDCTEIWDAADSDFEVTMEEHVAFMTYTPDLKKTLNVIAVWLP